MNFSVIPTNLSSKTTKIGIIWRNALEEIRNVEFSAVIDAGTKGNKKWTEILVRYWLRIEKK